MKSGIRDITISTLRNDGSLDIDWIEDHYSGRLYNRYINMPKEKVQELLEAILKFDHSYNKPFADENRKLAKTIMEQKEE